MAMSFSEEQVIEVLAQVFGSSDSRVLLGIGDDAAVVQGSAQQILTTDVAVEGVHFRSNWSTAHEIGQRIAAANIADVLAMNGKCDYLLVATTLTGRESLDWIRNLAQGIQDQATAAGAVVVGGDLARSETLSIAITAVGHADKVIGRSGAKPGESIYLSSLTGWSAAGLSMLQSGKHLSEKAIALYKVPQIDHGVDFSKATSMSDVSDSVMVQGAQMAKASGVGFAIDCDAIAQAEEFPQILAIASELGADIWSWILQGGEDHVLLATGNDLPGIPIGSVIDGSGVTAFNKNGEIKMAPVSWSHFS
jgi:thiamine-monophosphate kinase